jgi:hypothetical protein
VFPSGVVVGVGSFGQQEGAAAALHEFKRSSTSKYPCCTNLTGKTTWDRQCSGAFKQFCIDKHAYMSAKNDEELNTYEDLEKGTVHGRYKKGAPSCDVTFQFSLH